MNKTFKVEELFVAFKNCLNQKKFVPDFLPVDSFLEIGRSSSSSIYSFTYSLSNSFIHSFFFAQSITNMINTSEAWTIYVAAIM